MERIDYLALVDEYNTSLTNVLRGFRPKFEFLELWVPDEDHVKSILNLVDAAQDSDYFNIEVYLDNNLLSEIQINHLINELESLGVVISKGDSGILLIINASDAKSKQELSDLSGNNGIFYASGLKHFLSNAQYEGSLSESNEYLLLHANQDGCNLFLLVDSKYIIQMAKYSGATHDDERAILEATCSVIINRHMEEVHDYGVLMIENTLRENQFKPPVKGIVNVFNLNSLFNLPKVLIHSIFKQFIERSHYQIGQFYSGRLPTHAWLGHSDEHRKKIIRESIQQYFFEYHKILTLNYIENDIKVHFVLNSNLSLPEEGALILRLEKSLREYVDPSLQVYLEPHRDDNKIRELKKQNTL